MNANLRGTLSRLIALLVILAIVPSGVGSARAQQGPEAAAAAAGAVSQAEPAAQIPSQCFNGKGVTSALDPRTGKLSFVGTQAGQPILQISPLSAVATAEQAARNYLTDCGSFLGLDDQGGQLALLRETTADPGRFIERFQQVHQGIPVFGAQLVVQLDSQKNVISVSGNVLPGIKVDTQPTVLPAVARWDALQVVANAERVGLNALNATPAELWIYNPVLLEGKVNTASLVWSVQVTSKALAPIRYLVLLEAHSAEALLSINQVDTALSRLTYTTNNSTVRPGTLVCNESNPNCTGGDTDAVNAHVYAGDTYNFYSSYHGRDSLDNAGMALVSTVHYDVGYCNAFWDGAQMTYGDGCFIVADDVVAHEMTHGVTEHESGLIYAYQSGAINESFSDAWGEFVDQTNGKGTDTAAVKWLMGEDTSIGAIRNMKDPTALGSPDRMGSPLYYSGSGDNGGVHTNSGVNNKAVYLITDGDTFNGYTITGIGLTKTAKIYYEAQTNILTPSSNYYALYTGLYQACNNLVGPATGITSADCTQVRNATLATEMNFVPTPPANDDIDTPVDIGSLPYTSPSLDTSAASDPTNDPDFACITGKGSNTVWYTYTPGSAANLSFDTSSSTYDTVLAAYTGTPGSLTSVACNDDTSGSLQSAISFAASAGVKYYIEVASYSSGGGVLRLHGSILLPTTWQVKTPMSNSRAWVPAAGTNGKVYVIGGNGTAFGAQPMDKDGRPGSDGGWQNVNGTSVEAYDPSTNTWSAMTSKPTGVASTGAAVIGGEIYVPGGTYDGTPTAVLEAYDPVANSWSSLASMPATFYAGSVAAAGGKLYVMGGVVSGFDSNTCYVYDPLADSWGTCAALPATRTMAGAGVVNGKIYVVGGFDTSDNEMNTVYQYDPSANSWATKSPMPSVRGGPGAAGFRGWLYVCGGGWTTHVKSCDKYDPETNTWSAFDSLNEARYALALVQVDGNLYAEGGFDSSLPALFLTTNERNSSTVAAGIVRYAEPGGLSSGSCDSWATACELRYVMSSVAIPGDQVWVAAGTYIPTDVGDLTSSFILNSGVAVLGGFAGTETSASQRDPAANPTILSGHLTTLAAAADVPDLYSFHVIVSSGADSTAVLDGLEIMSGHATGPNNHATGGGIYNKGGSPTLQRLLFQYNVADNGGGLYNEGGHPVLTNVAFVGNNANAGGAISNVSGSHLVLRNATFSGNSAVGGGAMWNYGADILTILEHVTFSGNSASSGGAVANLNGAVSGLTNVILWGDSSDEVSNSASTFEVSNSVIQGGCGSIAGAACGSGNLSSDPHLAALADNGGFTPTMALLPGSSAIDTGANAACLPYDQRGEPRPQGLRCDIGSYEYIEPTVSQVFPPQHSTACLQPQVGVTLNLTDWTRTSGSLNLSAVALTLDGAFFSTTPLIIENRTYPASLATILFTPANPLTAGPHKAVFTYLSAGGTMMRVWSFNAANMGCGEPTAQPPAATNPLILAPWDPPAPETPTRPDSWITH